MEAFVSNERCAIINGKHSMGYCVTAYKASRWHCICMIVYDFFFLFTRTHFDWVPTLSENYLIQNMDDSTQWKLTAIYNFSWLCKSTQLHALLLHLLTQRCLHNLAIGRGCGWDKRSDLPLLLLSPAFCVQFHHFVSRPLFFHHHSTLIFHSLPQKQEPSPVCPPTSLFFNHYSHRAEYKCFRFWNGFFYLLILTSHECQCEVHQSKEPFFAFLYCGYSKICSYALVQGIILFIFYMKCKHLLFF